MLNSLGMKEKAEKLKVVQEEVKKKSDDPENVPNQVNSIQTFSQKLFEYFKANKIEAPSVAKIKEYSDQLSKE